MSAVAEMFKSKGKACEGSKQDLLRCLRDCECVKVDICLYSCIWSLYHLIYQVIYVGWLNP